MKNTFNFHYNLTIFPYQNVDVWQNFYIESKIIYS